MKVSKELLKGSTDLLVLSLIEKEPMYGYQMIKELSLKSQDIFVLQEGTLYPILHSLEEKNYISSYWDETGAKKRKYYTQGFHDYRKSGQGSFEGQHRKGGDFGKRGQEQPYYLRRQRG